MKNKNNSKTNIKIVERGDIKYMTDQLSCLGQALQQKVAGLNKYNWPTRSMCI